MELRASESVSIESSTGFEQILLKCAKLHNLQIRNSCALGAGFSLNVAVENGGRQNVDLELQILRVIANLDLVPLELDWKPTALHRI